MKWVNKIMKSFNCKKRDETPLQEEEYKFHAKVDKIGESQVEPLVSYEGTVKFTKKNVPSSKDETSTEPSEVRENKEITTKSNEQVANIVGSSKREPVKFSFLGKMKGFNTVTFRILLIDDKIGEHNDPNRFKDLNTGSLNIVIKNCSEHKCHRCPNHGEEKCKLHVIKQLMTCSPDGSNYHYWDQSNVETYYCPTVIKDFINDEKVDFSKGCTNLSNYPESINVYSEDEDIENGKLNIKCLFEPEIYEKKCENGTCEKRLNVQIVGVRDVRTALLLMSKYKFDMIFCDYLLDNKDVGSEERDFSIQLFEFLSHEYKEEKEQETDPAKQKRLEVLDQLSHDVLDNRGPLGKYWVMPITGFNQTFIQDLHRSGVNLIDYKWNINNGADPITTPWQFLYHLNKFLELQLRYCVFTMEQLLTFLLYTCQDLKTTEKTKLQGKKMMTEVDFYDFQTFMGSEYTTLIQLYGNKLPIKRDAVIEEDDENTKYKSVFATYVWKNFYANKKREFVNEIELYRLMQRFYHRASVMYKDQRGKKLLNDAYENLHFYIYTNDKVRNTIKNKKDGPLQELYQEGKGMSKLKEVVEKCTAE